MTARELRETRANLAEQANEIVNRAEAEKRAMTAEEQVSFDKIHADITSLRTTIDSIEKQASLNAELGESRGRPGREDTTRTAEQPTDEQRANDAFAAYLRYGTQGLNAEQRDVMAGRFSRDGVENRAAQTVTTTGGGYLIPAGFSGKLETSMLAYGGVAKVATSFDTETGNTLAWPTVNDTSVSGRLLAINTAVTETAVAYSVINFAAYKFSSDMVTVPVELMQDSAFNIDNHLAGVLGERLGRVHNTYQTTGTGSSQPQGIVVGASSGVTAASATAVTFNELLDLVHSVDPAYRNQPGAGFMFNDAALKFLRKLKDGDGRPAWQPGLAGGEPDKLLGYDYTINQDMAAMTTGLKPILFGALRKFHIRRVKGITLLRLDERYADLHQVAFLAFTRWDSKVLDAGTDPVKYITLA